MPWNGKYIADTFVPKVYFTFTFTFKTIVRYVCWLVIVLVENISYFILATIQEWRASITIFPNVPVFISNRLFEFSFLLSKNMPSTDTLMNYKYNLFLNLFELIAFELRYIILYHFTVSIILYCLRGIQIKDDILDLKTI